MSAALHLVCDPALILDLSVKSGGKLISWRLSFLCSLEVAVNYYTYCSDFRGRLCYGSYIFSARQDRNRGNVLICAVLLAATCLAAHRLSVYLNRKRTPVEKKLN
jgi:hypothetical protein